MVVIRLQKLSLINTTQGLFKRIILEKFLAQLINGPLTAHGSFKWFNKFWGCLASPVKLQCIFLVVILNEEKKKVNPMTLLQLIIKIMDILFITCIHCVFGVVCRTFGHCSCYNKLNHQLFRLFNR